MKQNRWINTTWIGIVVWAGATALHAEDWPQFRGPNRDGVSAEKGLLQKWPAGGPPKVWTASNIGNGHGSVAVVRSVVYILGQSRAVWRDGKPHITALDETTGKAKWSVPFSDLPTKGDNVNSTPTFANGKLYAVSQVGDLACLGAADGKVLWHKSLAEDFGGKDPGWGGFSESVLVDDGTVICAPGSMSAALAALNANTGEVIWKTEMPKANTAGFASAIKAEFGDVPMYLILLNRSQGGLTAVHAKTGKVLWQNGANIMGGPYLIPNPIVKGDMIYTSTGDGWAALQMTASGKDAVSVKLLKRYASLELACYYGGMVMIDDAIYFAHRKRPGGYPPACVDAKTREIKWKAEDMKWLTGDGTVDNCSGSIIGADGMLYFQYENGAIALVKADPKQFTLVSTFKVPESSVARNQAWRSNPAIANGKLYIRIGGNLHCFNIKAEGK